MKIIFTRKTGFYGMGSPIEILKNGERWFTMANNQVKEVELEAKKAEIQVRFFFMKSQVYTIDTSKQELFLEIGMNPILLLNYVTFFGVFLLIPLIRISIPGVLIILLFYFIFLFSMLRKAYVIKEQVDGTES